MSVSVFGFQVKDSEDAAGAFRVRATVSVCVVPPPVTVIAAVLVPGEAVAVFTLTVIVPLFEPDVGLTVGHVALLLTVHVPLELTVMDWLTGFAAPRVAVNERLADDTVKDAAAVMVNVTGTVTAEAPVAGGIEYYGITIGAGRQSFFYRSTHVMAPLPAPEAGPRDKLGCAITGAPGHGAAPVLSMLSVWDPGLPPPCWAVKDRLVGLAPIAGLTEPPGIGTGTGSGFVLRTDHGTF